MFPTLNYLLNYLFGTDISFNFPPTFGFMVALAFISAAWVLGREFIRKQKLGLIRDVTREVEVGAPATTSELVSNAVIGFLVGFKILGAFLDTESFKANPQEFLLSSQGSFVGGLIGAAILGYLKYAEKKKTVLPKPEKRMMKVPATDLVSSITMVAAVSGILGAKIFHNLEYWDQFTADPWGSLFSASGLTFYGGLIGGFLGVWWYARKNGIGLIHVADAVAPGLILAYAVGRIGCMAAGDGDWGVINSAYRIDEATRSYVVVPESQFMQDITPVYQHYGDSPESIRQIYFEQPAALSFLPDWFFAFDFPHNVNNEGVAMQNCEGAYCARLPLPVFPTPIYETIAGLLIFGFLWIIRKRIRVAGQMFFIYLILNGLERFFIEKIRVNATIDMAGFAITQAEIISTSLILIGILGLFFSKRIEKSLLRM